MPGGGDGSRACRNLEESQNSSQETRGQRQGQEATQKTEENFSEAQYRDVPGKGSLQAKPKHFWKMPAIFRQTIQSNEYSWIWTTVTLAFLFVIFLLLKKPLAKKMFLQKKDTAAGFLTANSFKSYWRRLTLIWQHRMNYWDLPSFLFLCRELTLVYSPKILCNCKYFPILK